ncbi:MAG TPA: type II toxin-antitoxin system RelE/ParE family toxin [Elusimicrobiota bacterium]|nr:type II toxin-antitoxin system RelE/ParE family toxin [Elusimicrobiota bacterium]
MRRTFVETSSFARRADQEGPDALREIQAELLKRLESGRVIPGTGGLRKLRIADAGRNKGARGGYRVIYLDLPRIERTYLLALYDKGEKDDISSEEKKILRLLSSELKGTAK